MELTRLSVNMNAETTAALREIADRRGATYTEAVRRAISLAKFFDDELAAGNTVVSVSRDGKTMREWVVL